MSPSSAAPLGHEPRPSRLSTFLVVDVEACPSVEEVAHRKTLLAAASHSMAACRPGADRSAYSSSVATQDLTIAQDKATQRWTWLPAETGVRPSLVKNRNPAVDPVDPAGGEEQLADAVLAVICERVSPHRPRGRGPASELLVANHDDLKAWLVEQGLTG